MCSLILLYTLHKINLCLWRTGKSLTLSQTSPVFYASAVQVFWKHCRKRRNCLSRAISCFPIVFSSHLENILPFSFNFNCRLHALSVWKLLKGLYVFVYVWYKCYYTSFQSFTKLFQVLITLWPITLFENIVGQRENIGNKPFLLFTKYFRPYQSNLIISRTINLSTSFNFDESKILLFQEDFNVSVFICIILPFPSPKYRNNDFLLIPSITRLPIIWLITC